MNVERMFELACRLIEIDSVTGNEGPIIDFLETELKRRGLTTERFDVAPNRQNLFASYDGGKPIVLFNTHVDTVPPQYGPRETEDRIFGRGACDTHGILAAMLEAMDDLHRSGSNGLGILLTVDEEGGLHQGAHEAGRNLPAPAILVVGEPTENRLMTYQKGLLKADLIAYGVEGHSGYPERCDSALDRLWSAIEAIRSASWVKNRSAEGTTVNVVIKEGGDAYNKVPGFARAGLFFRLSEPMAVIRSRIEHGLQLHGDTRVEIQWLGGNDPVTDLQVVEGFETGVAAYNTDIAHFGWAGCRTFLFGPGSIAQAHRDFRGDAWEDAEWIDKREMRRGAELYVQLVRRALGD